MTCRLRFARGGKDRMIANAVFVATLIFLALGFGMMHELHFLVPWRSLILHSYLKSIALH